MATIRERFGYLTASLEKKIRGASNNCLNYASAQHEWLDPKYLVTHLRRITDCRLMYRAPSIAHATASDFRVGEAWLRADGCNAKCHDTWTTLVGLCLFLYLRIWSNTSRVRR